MLATKALSPEVTKVAPSTMAYDSSLIISANMVFVDSDGKKYMSEDLTEETVLLTYEEDGKEVYFLGQYNNNYHWDGYCITNSYNEDGTLDGICESNFEDGVRLDYISLYKPSDSDEFYYGNRIIKNGVNIGVTKHFKFDNSYEKKFTKSNVRITDILKVDDFLKNKDDLIMTEYYNGNTENGGFNDDSGKAYRITFDDYGRVLTLYHGRFKNKNANDDTLSAYSIIYSKENEGYYYNSNTTFTDGYADVKSTHKLTPTEMSELVSDIKVDDLDLKWIGLIEGL